MPLFVSLLAGCLLAYLMGSFSSAVWIGKWFYGTDVRTQGSGNAGATNTIRALGTTAGVIVMLLDVLKAWGAVMMSGFFGMGKLSETQMIDYRIVMGSLAVIGHIFPVFTGFKGGKGVASMVGVVIALYSPYIFLLVLAWFIIVFVLTRYVSLASITASILFAILVVFIFHEKNVFLFALALMVAVFIPIMHHKNIKRLLRGEESKLSFRRK